MEKLSVTRMRRVPKKIRRENGTIIVHVGTAQCAVCGGPADLLFPAGALCKPCAETGFNMMREIAIQRGKPGDPLRTLRNSIFVHKRSGRRKRFPKPPKGDK
ncbi:MAG: hypothetical protein K6T83_02950 [Alicyclobacillus sp.]|nr:hypothetical protein [Alicyclobacillus sp.]